MVRMDTNPAYGSELRVSGRVASALLALLGLGLTFISDRVPSALHLHVQLLAVVCYVFSGLSWLAHIRSSLAGRWLAVAGFVALLLSSSYWLGRPELLALSSIPVALAAALVGIGAAGAVAVGETALLVLLGPRVAAGFPSPMAWVALAGIWATAVVMVMVYVPVYRRAQWLHAYFQYAENSGGGCPRSPGRTGGGHRNCGERQPAARTGQ